LADGQLLDRQKVLRLAAVLHPACNVGKATAEGACPLVGRVSARQSRQWCADQVWSGQPRRRQSSSRRTSVCGCWQTVRLVAGPISPSSRQRASMIRAATTRARRSPDVAAGQTAACRALSRLTSMSRCSSTAPVSCVACAALMIL